jgi:cold shock CspA family protein
MLALQTLFAKKRLPSSILKAAFSAVTFFINGLKQPAHNLFMAKSQQTWLKKEREKQKQKDRKEKEEKMQERKEKGKDGKSLDDMMAYIDENGNISSTPPDPSKKRVINVEDIEIGVPKHKPIDPEDLIRKGTITFFNQAKGYGFIKDQQSQESVFVHINSLLEPVKENNRVTFEVEMGPKGPSAVKVKIVR